MSHSALSASSCRNTSFRLYNFTTPSSSWPDRRSASGWPAEQVAGWMGVGAGLYFAAWTPGHVCLFLPAAVITKCHIALLRPSPRSHAC